LITGLVVLANDPPGRWAEPVGPPPEA